MTVDAPATWRRVPMTAAHAVVAFDVPDSRRPEVALVQFVKDWNRSDTTARQDLVAPPGLAGTERAVAVVAAVAHALLDRDGGAVPAWVSEARASEDITTCGAPVSSPFGRRIVDRAPATCAQHRVYFSGELLERR
jgi:hypothetical protein